MEFGLLAVQQLVEAGLDIEYHILGGGEEEEKLCYLVHELGLEKQFVPLSEQTAGIPEQSLLKEVEGRDTDGSSRS